MELDFIASNEFTFVDTEVDFTWVMFFVFFDTLKLTMSVEDDVEMREYFGGESIDGVAYLVVVLVET